MNKKVVYIFVFLVLGLFVISACNLIKQEEVGVNIVKKAETGGGEGDYVKENDMVYAYGIGLGNDPWNNHEAKPNWNCINYERRDIPVKDLPLNVIHTEGFQKEELNGKSFIEFASIGANTHENHHLMLDATVERKVNGNWELLTTTADGNMWIGDRGNWERGSTTNKYYGCRLNEECVRSGRITITDTMRNGDALRVKVLACGNHETGEVHIGKMGYFLRSATSVVLKQ